MTFREGVCLNRQSTVIWRKGVWPNCHIITVIVTKKLNLQFILVYLRFMWGRGWLKTSYGERLAENIRIPLYGWERV